MKKNNNNNYHSTTYGVDLWNFFFGKIQKSDLQEPPKFKQFVLPKFGSTTSYHSGKQFLIKFCFYSQSLSIEINHDDG